MSFLWDLEEQKRGRGFKFIIWWGPSHKVGTILYEWIAVDPSRLFPFSEEYVTPMTVAKDVADHPKNPSSCVKNHFFVYDAAARTCSCSSWCSSYFWWRSWEKETMLIKIVLMVSDKSKLNMEKN